MTTREMIEVMEAFERGEAIQVKIMGSKDKWVDLKTSCWNWFEFVYRVKPKIDPEFELGEKVVDIREAGRMCPNIWEYGSYKLDAPVELAKVDEVLWYWEYQTTKGEWNKTSWRYTKKRAKSVILHSEQATLTPLYALGFRLPKEN